MVTAYILYHSPGACSRVTLSALEEVGVEFEDLAVVLGRGEQKAPEYLALNPKGKVPTLRIDDQTLTENPAILWYLAAKFPETGLLPGMGDAVTAAQALSDLVWCGGTLHPLVQQMFRPNLYSESSPDSVKQNAFAKFDGVAATIRDRVSGRWWYGDHWSIVDVYIYWITTMARMAGYQFADAAAITGHDERVRARASFQRALKREEDAVALHQIPLPPGAKL
jgi:glutathione S-transferase